MNSKFISPEKQISSALNERLKLIQEIAKNTSVELNKVRLQNLTNAIKDLLLAKQTVLQKNLRKNQLQFNVIKRTEMHSELEKIYLSYTDFLDELLVKDFNEFLKLYNLNDDIVTLNNLPETIFLGGKNIDFQLPITFKSKFIKSLQQNYEYLLINEAVLASLLQNANNIKMRPYCDTPHLFISGQTKSGKLNLLVIADKPPRIIQLNQQLDKSRIELERYLDDSQKFYIDRRIHSNTEKLNKFTGFMISGLKSTPDIKKAETLTPKYKQTPIEIEIINSSPIIKEFENAYITYNNKEYNYQNTEFRADQKIEYYENKNGDTVIKSYKRIDDNSYILEQASYVETNNKQKKTIKEYFNNMEEIIKTQTYTVDIYDNQGFKKKYIDWFEGDLVQTTLYDQGKESAVLTSNPQKHYMVSSTGNKITHIANWKRGNKNLDGSEYLKFLAKNLITRKDFDLFIKTLFQYKYDKQDSMQTPLETIYSSSENSTKMTGDCEDLANLINEILKQQGKNSLLLALPGHATTIWLEKLKDNKLIALSAGTFGVQQSSPQTSQKDALNDLFKKYNGGKYSKVNYQIDQDVLHLPFQQKEKKLFTIISLLSLSIEKTNKIYNAIQSIALKLQTNFEDADHLFEEIKASLGKKEQQLLMINYSKLLLNHNSSKENQETYVSLFDRIGSNPLNNKQKSYLIDYCTNLLENGQTNLNIDDFDKSFIKLQNKDFKNIISNFNLLAIVNNLVKKLEEGAPKKNIQQHISSLKLDIYLHLGNWQKAKNELATLKENSFYKYHKYYRAYYRLMKTAPHIFSIEEGITAYKECDNEGLKMRIKYAVIEKLFANKELTRVYQMLTTTESRFFVFFKPLIHKLYREFLAENNFDKIISLTLILSRVHTEHGILNDQFDSVVLSGEKEPAIPLFELIEILPDKLLYKLFKTISPIEISKFFRFILGNNHYSFDFSEKPISKKYITDCIMKYDLTVEILSDLKKLQNKDDLTSTNILKVILNTSIMSIMLRFSPDRIEDTQDLIMKILINNDIKSKDMTNSLKKGFYLMAINIYIGFHKYDHEVLDHPLIKYIKSVKQTTEIKNSEIDDFLSKNNIDSKLNDLNENRKSVIKKIIYK